MALRVTRAAARRVAAVRTRAARRLTPDIWPLLQGTAAATLAWLIAHDLLGRPEPFFAPIAALIALNTSLGERGLNALRLLQGVFIGIVVGEIALATLGGGFGSLAIATFAATAAARVVSDMRLVIGQAAASAVLTIAIASGEAGTDRLTDALIGAGVALVFSQLLFSPEPLALLRRAEVAVLERLAAGLALSARALGEEHEDLAERAIAELRELPGDVSELRRLRRASAHVARRTLVWRSQRHLVVRENENAAHLDLLGMSCLTVARVVPSLSPPERETVRPTVSELADVLAELAAELGDRTIRQRAADQAFAVATSLGAWEADPASNLAVAAVAVRMLAIDVMVFAGVELDVAIAAVREGLFDHQVPAPAARSRGLARLRSRLRRR